MTGGKIELKSNFSSLVSQTETVIYYNRNISFTQNFLMPVTSIATKMFST